MNQNIPLILCCVLSGFLAPLSVKAQNNDLRVTELMYNPAGGSDYEFIELYNASALETFVFNGEVFTNGIDYTIASGVQIPPLGYLLIVRDASANFSSFKTYYGLDDSVSIIGPYGGNLSNGGERIELNRIGDGEQLIAFEYNDSRGWHLEADGAGHSLVPLVMEGQTDNALNFGGNWRPSMYIGGSPGSADPTPVTNIILNEVSPHTDTGLPAPADSNDWFEIVNTSDYEVNLTGWYVSDDASNLTKYELSGGYSSIAAGGRLTFDENNHFNNPAGTGFGVTKSGEQLFLSYLPASDNNAWRVADVARFKGVENEGDPSYTSWGRYPDLGDWWKVTTTSRDQANAASADVVIGEFMYHPLNDSDVGEYIELWNPTAQPIALYDETEGPWRINGGVEYTLPANLILSANQRILLVNFDPQLPANMAAFQALYSGFGGSIFGPFETGSLSNEGERITLERPQSEDLPGEGISWVIVDEVIYFDQSPWTSDADGTGLSMQRVDANVPGSDWNNWVAVTPNPNSIVTVLTMQMTCDALTSGEKTGLHSVPFSVFFSEAVDGFVKEDILLTNAIVVSGSFSEGNGRSIYTFNVAPLANGQVTVEIPAMAAQAASDGSFNLQSASFFFDYQENPSSIQAPWIIE